jgi:copper transport protein
MRAVRSWRRRLALAPAWAAVVLGIVLLVSSPASAHATLQGSTPAPNTVLHQPPASVDLTFNEGVTLLPDSVRVFGPDGGQVDDQHVTHPHGDGGSVGVGLRAQLGAGTYLVAYRIISADSHPISGAYTFSIGHRSTAPTGDIAGGSSGVALGLGVSRWLTYAGSALGLGGLAFLSWCWPAGWASRRARRLVHRGVGLLAVGTLLALLLKGPYDAGRGLGQLADGALLREVLGTTYGRALGARLVLLALLVLLLARRTRLSRRLVAVGSSAVLVAVGVTFALCGHAAAGSNRPLALVSDTAHVAAMSAWLGGLVLLGAVVLTRDARPDDAVPVVHRFSTLAAGGLCVLVATGAYQAVRELGSWDTLWFAHYGHVLLIKLGVVSLALLAAAGSRAWVWQSHHPVVAVHATTTAAPVETAREELPPLRRLRISVVLESLLLLGVLVASAVLVTSDPARPAFVAAPVSTVLRTGPDSVRVSADPTGQNRVLLRLQVLDQQGNPVKPREVDAAFLLTSQQIGPLPVVLSEDVSPGLLTGAVSLPVSGEWQLAVTVRTSAVDEATASVDVPVG